MTQKIKRILEFLENNDNYLLTAHMNADGDAYGSMLAMAYFLEKKNKRYRIILDDQKLEKKYEYFWGFDKIQHFDESISPDFNAAVVLDVPSRKRIGEPARLLPSPEKCVKIDHHPVEDNFAAYYLIDTKASSTSRLVFDLLKESDIKLSDAVATLLFSGIMYDTGRFSFSNTSRKDFLAAAELLRYKVVPFEISNRIFFDNSLAAMKIIGYGLANLESCLDGRLAIIHLPLKIMNENYSSEIEELANYSVSIKGVEVGLFVREISPGSFKVSFRSKGRVNVNAIARAFDGGGHLHAAGCHYQGTYSELRKKLLAETLKNL